MSNFMDSFVQKAKLVKNGVASIEDLRAIELGEIPEGLSYEEFSQMKAGIADMKNDDVTFTRKPKSSEVVLDYVRQIEIMNQHVSLPSSILSFTMLKGNPDACTDEEYESLVDAVQKMHQEYASALMEPICSRFALVADEEKTYRINPEMDDNKKLAISCACYKLMKKENPAADPYATAVTMCASDSILHYEALGAAGRLKTEEVATKVKHVAYKAMCLFNKMAAPVLTFIGCCSVLALLSEHPYLFTIAAIYFLWNFKELSREYENMGHAVERGVTFVGSKLIQFGKSLWNKMFPKRMSVPAERSEYVSENETERDTEEFSPVDEFPTFA